MRMNTVIKVSLTTLTALAMVGVQAIGTAADAAPPTSTRAGGDGSHGLVVNTDKGQVRGIVADGVQNFLGIPYAASPTAGRRWKPPQPARRWSGVKDATRFGSVCPQNESLDSPRLEDENCLFVNVERPVGTSRSDRLPVYVYIHGGGLTGGSGNNENPNKIVRRTGVVAVTMNYRLGIFGFMGLPGLTHEAGESGNYGFEDQQAALRWVRRNIAHFGGNPDRVTIGGESAGGWSVCGHLTSPGSRGLFHRAMIQSGACTTQTQAKAEAAGTALARSLGCTDATAAATCLRGKSAGELLDSQGVPATFVRGTRSFPVDPRTQIDKGRFRHVPVVVGATLDEGRSFQQDKVGWTQAQYERQVRSDWGTQLADTVLAEYPWPAHADDNTAAYLLADIQTDSGSLGDRTGRGIGGCANRSLTRDLARYTRTYAYEWAPPATSPAWFETPGYHWGAGHATELPYLFPDRNSGANAALFNAHEKRLSRDLIDYWGAFVKKGHPSATDQAHWPSYNRTHAYLSLRTAGRSTLISDARYSTEHHCGFWNSLTSS
jgi:carboxylesterase type B